MRSLSTTLRDARYYGTLPYRKALLSALAKRGQAPICVLFYHRVADTHANDWTISRNLFARHIEWLQAHTELISLAEAQHRITTGTSHRMAACITFDDGYAENCEFALPLLVDQKIPCTYFVSLSFIEDGHPFPHDANRDCPLPVNTIQQLRDMVSHGIEIGAHTRTHPDLGAIYQRDILVDEVVDARDELQDILKAPVSYFAFPYGQLKNLSSTVYQLAKEHGFHGVCSAYGGYNVPGGDSFHLQRIHGDPDWSRFRNWLTIDPRKLSHPDLKALQRMVDPETAEEPCTP